jgi:hypothetical protein
MSEARHQLLITLVHGTWPRGLFRTFFPRIVRFKQCVRRLMRRKPLDTPPFWFQEGSPFLARLSTELCDIPHKITPRLWSGANSIRVRDETAHALAEHLAAEHTEHPQATQLIIAHSHGGNIAHRALYHLQKRDAPQLSGADNANPLVVTLATPFIEVHQADFGDRPSRVRVAISVSITSLLWLLALAIFSVGLWSSPMLIFTAVLFSLNGFLSWYWIVRRATARQNKVEALTDATRFGQIASAQAQRLLVIRAIDDEASLALALGTIFDYVITRTIMYSLLWLPLIPLLLGMLSLGWSYNAAQILGYALIIMLLGALMVSRSVHGRELAVSPMECQINTQSAPDATDLSQIVTLISHGYVKSLRHGIYEHENCARAISDWIRSQFRALPAR